MNQMPKPAVTMTNATAPMNSADPSLILPLTRDTTSVPIHPALNSQTTIAATSQPVFIVWLPPTA
jgi:hypothetical protein